MNSKISFKIPYYIQNCGDGSASIRLCSSLDEAAQLDEEAQQDNGWGESSAAELDVYLEGNKLCFELSKWNGKKYITKVVRLKGISNEST